MLDRTVAPPFVRTTSFDLIQPAKTTLASGAEAYFVLGGQQDVSKVELIFPAGRWVEKSWGASYFTGQLLSKGTKSKSSFDIASRFDSLGAHLEVNTALDYVGVSLYSLNKNLEGGLALLLEVLTEAIFPDKELEQTKAIYLQNLKVNREKTSFQASTLLRKTIFGNDHPYGKELDDTEVQALTRDQLAAHFANCFKAATVIVSGKMSDKQQQLVTSMLSPFAFNTLNGAVPAPSPMAVTPRQHVQKEGSVQSTIRLGKKSIGRKHADYAETLFLTHILGGYFGSRLMKNIREDKGLSYGISAGLHTLRHDNYFVIGADVNSENLTLTFDEIAKEVNRLRIEPVGSEELETARNHFVGSLQAEITTSFAHADKLKNILLYNLAPGHYQNMINRVVNLTTDDLLRVANAHLAEGSFAEVAVG